VIFAHRLERESGGHETEGPNIREPEGGDIIIVGRNTFKEVVRGLHEGYLLPLNYIPPPPPPAELNKDGEVAAPTPPNPIPPAIPTSEYPSLADPSPFPDYTFTYMPSLHLLGIRHTPKRIYRFLTRRYMADEICEQVVACILQQSQREWSEEDSRHGQDEERYWPKTVSPVAEWREDVVVDTRIRPKLFWRQPSEVHEVYDYREPLAGLPPVDVEKLRPTEEELAEEQVRREQSPPTSLFGGPNPFGRL
jgi:hypothetical protein